MKSKVKYLLFSVLAGYGFMAGTSALENSDIIVSSENNTTYASFSKEYNLYKDAEDDLNDFISFVEKQNGRIISIVKPNVVKTNKTTIATGKFEADDLVRIQEKAEALKKEYSDKNTDDVIYSVEFKDVVTNTVATPTGEVKKTSSEFGPFSTIKEARKVKRENEAKSTEYHTSECKVIPDIEKDVIDSKSIEEKFDTLEDAKEYIESLQAEGFDTGNIEPIEDKTTETKKETKESYDKTELDEYVQKLKAEGFDGTANYSEKEVVVDQKTETIEDKKFSSETEAINYKNELEKTYSKTSLKVKNASYIKEENRSISETYTTYEEANNRLNELKANYTVTSNDIKTIGTGSGKVTYAKKYDSNSIYNLEDNNFVILKQGSGNIAVWTMEQLSNAKQATLISSYYEYNKKNNVDGSTTGVDNVKFIYGLGTFNLKELGNNWGDYTFSQNTNGQVTLTCDAKKISHVIIGSFDKSVSYQLTANYIEKITVPEYIVSGTITKDITATLYTVEIDMIKETIEYTVKGDIIKTTEKPIYKVTCNVTDIITSDVTTYEQEYSVVQNNKIYLASAKGILNDNNIVPVSTTVVPTSKTIVPKTGINGGNYDYLLFILTVLMVILNIKYFAKEN